MSSSLGALDDRLQEARELAGRGEHGRADAILRECVLAEPANGELFQSLLENLAEKLAPATGERGASGHALSETPAGWSQAVAARDWPVVLRLGLKHLADHGWQLPTLLALADAFDEQGVLASEYCVLQRALALAPDDREANRRAGRLLGRLRRFDDALACWKRVESADPEDAEAAQAFARLTIERSRQQLGIGSQVDELAALLSGAASRRFAGRLVSTSEGGPVTAPSVVGQWGAEMKRTPIQQLEVAIREFPSNAEYYLQLTPLYLEKGREYDAEKLLAKGRAATDHDPRVSRLWEDVSMLRLQRKLDLAERRAADEGTAESQAELAEVKSERDQLETDIFVSRVRREPENAAVRCQLAQRMRRAGKLREACQQLEAALGDPDHGAAAALEMGHCRQQMGEPAEALRYFRQASEFAALRGQPTIQAPALYLGGSLAAKLKLRRLAERYLAALCQLDPHYQDAAAVLAEVRRGGGERP